MEQKPSPFPPLNRLFVPKAEPSDLPAAAASPSASGSAAAPILIDDDDDSLYVQFTHLARAFHTSFTHQLHHPAPPPADPAYFAAQPNNGAAYVAFPPNNGAGPSNAVAFIATPPTTPTTAVAAAAPGAAVAGRKRRTPRSADMVRVSGLDPGDSYYFRSLVRHTRITYDNLRLFLLHHADHRRPDMTAATLMMDSDLFLHRDKRIIGPQPGIYIGDIFFFRMELCVLGLHGQVQAGIDTVPPAFSPNREPIATSIIVSGGYEDDDDAGDVLIYTGQGGKLHNSSRQADSQKLQGGNLALERSLEYGIELRVIRGIKSESSPTGKVYVYDGIYKVVEYWLDKGKSGFGVYKYKIVRMEGQQEMGSSILKLAEELKLNPLVARPKGYASLNFSMGKENLPIYLFNDFDNDTEPLFFEYVARPFYPSDIVGGGVGGGCLCMDVCGVGCRCIQRNGGEIVYDASGILLKGKPLIYECGPFCGCPPSCLNRVTQKGIRHMLEVFRSPETGWGVRCLDPIRAGTFICEFSGIVLNNQQAQLLSMNEDNLVHPHRFPARWAEWGDLSNVFPEYKLPEFPLLPQLSFAIDVSRARNVACYLSHSNRPNVFVQFVLFDHYNAYYPHLMIFAMENIPPLRELSLDYGHFEESAGTHDGGSNGAFSLLE